MYGTFSKFLLFEQVDGDMDGGQPGFRERDYSVQEIRPLLWKPFLE
jgi:hypothetical protein